MTNTNERVGYTPLSRGLRLLTLGVMLFLILCAGAVAQKHALSGVVKDTQGAPIVGVQILIGPKVVGITDAEGAFRLEAQPSETLTFRFVGMLTVNEPVGNRTHIEVVMREDVSNLEEVVVVGYGTQKRAHVTGSVATVSGKELTATPVSNPTQLLAGKLPGIISNQLSGVPGGDGASLMVRGFTSFQGNNGPLILVDGIERGMADLDTQDIESITVLKDAAAAAVYGMRAAEGVILVTTKRGRKEASRISYAGSWTFSKPTALPRFANGYEYMKYHNLANELDGKPVRFTKEMMEMVQNGDPGDGFENTDWLAPALKSTLMQQHTLSVSGGTDRVNYYLSGGVLRQNGFLENHRVMKYNVRSNIDARPFENFKIRLDISARRINPYQPTNLSWANQAPGNIYGLLMQAAPWVPREYQGMPTSPTRLMINPYYYATTEAFSAQDNYVIESLARMEYDVPFVKGLKLGLSASYDLLTNSAKSMDVPHEVMAWNFQGMTYNLSRGNSFLAVPKGALTQTESRSVNRMLRPSIEYVRTFNDLHSVNALLLWEQIEHFGQNMGATREEYDFFTIPDLNKGNMINPKLDSGNSGSSLRSANAGLVGRLSYAYDSKYLVEGSFRYDGSYVFAPAYRWGFFPSLSMGWVLSREEFMQEAAPALTHLKLRASVGTLGRNPISPFLYAKSYDYQHNNVAFGTPPAAGSTIYNMIKYPMEDLTWEKTRTYNVGVELNAWNGLLGLEFDYFYKYTYDILQSAAAAYPPSLGGRFPG